MATKTQTDNSQLQVEWEKLHSDAEKAGLPDGIVTELLIRICKDLKQDVKLTPTTLTELQNALKLEISLAGSQQSEPVTPAQPETLASPVQPVETDSQTNGTNPHERRKQLLLEVFGPDVLLDMDEAAACPETLLGAIKAKADNFGITPADVDMRHRAIANLRELMSLEVIDELDDKVNEIIEKRLQEAPEPLQPVVPQELPTVTVPAESQSNKQTRTRRAKVETSKEKSDNQSHKAKAPPAIFALEGHTLTNCFTGEVKQASVIEERLALLLLKKSNIEKLLKQVKQDIDGMLACYKLGILEIARPEFARQRKPDGTFRRSSLVSEYLIVTRKTTGGIVCADTKARDSWLAGMDYATTQLYGDAIRVSYSVNADALPKLAKEDALPPGYIQAEEDDIGDIAIKINPKAFADEDDGGADQDGDE